MHEFFTGYEEFEKLMKDSDKDTFMAYTKALYYFANPYSRQEKIF